MNKKKTFADRMQDVIDDLIERKIVKSQAAVAMRIGYDKTSLNQVLKGVREMPQPIVEEVLAQYNVNREWLLNGVGRMYAEGVVQRKGAVPYYNLRATAGDVTLPDQDKREVIEGYIDLPGWGDCDYVLPVWGESMFPDICSGDLIAVKRLIKWEYIRFGEAYLVVTDEHRMVKYLRKGKDDDHVLVCSKGTSYDPFNMPVTEIRQLYIVKGVIKRRMN